MKRKILSTILILIGALVLLVLVSGQILARLGFETFCITGKPPHLRIVPCANQAARSPTATPYPLPTAASQNPTPVIFDDDGSPDGLIALLFFLHNPQFEVKAVTISQGEAHPAVFADQIAQLLADLGQGDIPVGYGRETPLSGNNAFPAPWREASDRIYDIPLTGAALKSEPRPAAALIIDTLSQSEAPVMIFLSGSHTNLAEVLREKPEISAKISAVHIMGGSIYAPGNIQSDWPEIHNTVAEWNIWADPQAAKEVFASGLPLHLVPLDATQQITWSQSDAQGWKSTSNPEARLAGDTLDWMLRSWSLDAVMIWDLATAAISSDARLCPEENLALDVIVEPGPNQGQTMLTQGSANVWVCLKPDAGQIRARVDRILRR